MRTRVIAGLCCLLAWSAPTVGAIKQDLIVADWFGRQLVRVDGGIGGIKSVFAKTSMPRMRPFYNLNGRIVDGVLGPDGLLYVSDLDSGVWRFDYETGYIRDFFAASGQFPGETRPVGIAFAPDGSMLVAVQEGVVRFDGQTGERLERFFNISDVPPGTMAYLPGVDHLRFGPDGNLYITSVFGSEVVRLDGQTGEFIDIFARGSGLGTVRGTAFDAQGHLLVASFGTGEIIRFDGTTGEFINVFASTPELYTPNRMEFGSDGLLYVSDEFLGSILRFDGESGAFIDVFADGLVTPVGLFFAPEPGVGMILLLGVAKVGRRRDR